MYPTSLWNVCVMRISSNVYRTNEDHRDDVTMSSRRNVGLLADDITSSPISRHPRIAVGYGSCIHFSATPRIPPYWSRKHQLIHWLAACRSVSLGMQSGKVVGWQFSSALCVILREKEGHQGSHYESNRSSRTTLMEHMGKPLSMIPSVTSRICCLGRYHRRKRRGSDGICA